MFPDRRAAARSFDQPRIELARRRYVYPLTPRGQRLQNMRCTLRHVLRELGVIAA
jgi:hypothetical protein